MGRGKLNARIRFGDDVGEVTEFLDEPNSGLAVLQVRGHSFTVPAAFIEAALDGSIELTGVERSKTEGTGTPAPDGPPLADAARELNRVVEGAFATPSWEEFHEWRQEYHVAKMKFDNELRRLKAEPPSADVLARLVGECEQDRLNAELSGLETGWEHPATRTSWRKVVAAAKAYRAPKGGERNGDPTQNG